MPEPPAHAWPAAAPAHPAAAVVMAPVTGPRRRRIELRRPDGTPSRVHVVGAAGTGMTALVRLLLALGQPVSGSDIRDAPELAAFREAGAAISIGQAAANVEGADLVVTSTAVPASNVEVAAAARLGIPVVHRADLLARLMDGKTGVAVAGTHGKTTTTSMLTMALRAAGADPSYAIGGDVHATGSNAGVGAGALFVVEADESDESFLELRPDLAVVTNVEADHLDHYRDLDAVQAAFRAFVALLPPAGTAVLNADDPGAAALAADALCPVVLFGFGPDAGLRGMAVRQVGLGSQVTVAFKGEELGRLHVPVPGLHNVANALAATAAALLLGTPFQAVQSALAAYTGVARRFETRAVVDGVTLIDDYAHHPTEIAAVLAAAASGPWERIVAVFQPHRYSRTAALGPELGRALGVADVAVVTDVYGAGEQPLPGVSGRLVAAAAEQSRPGADVTYVQRRSDLAQAVAPLLRSGDVVLSLGAGDITLLARELHPLLTARGAEAARR